MKRFVFFVLFLIFNSHAVGQQLQVRYRNASGQIVQMPTNSITSDFGKRYSSWNGSKWSPSPWHRGFDYQPKDCEGMALVSIASGKVQKIENLFGSVFVS